jgi:hypothetical protein
MKAWAAELGLSGKAMAWRLANWSVEKALTTPKPESDTAGLPDNTKYLTWNGKTQSYTAWTKELGFGVTTINRRLKAEWSVERTLSTPLGQPSCIKPETVITCNGKTQTLSQWSAEVGISRLTISARICRSWPVEDALLTPLGSGRLEYQVKNRYLFEGEMLSIGQIAARSGRKYGTMYNRLKVRGWTVKDAAYLPSQPDGIQIRNPIRTLTYCGETKSYADWGRVTGIKREAIRARTLAGWSVAKTLTTPVKTRPKKCTNQ